MLVRRLGEVIINRGLFEPQRLGTDGAARRIFDAVEGALRLLDRARGFVQAGFGLRQRGGIGAGLYARQFGLRDGQRSLGDGDVLGARAGFQQGHRGLRLGQCGLGDGFGANGLVQRRLRLCERCHLLPGTKSDPRRQAGCHLRIGRKCSGRRVSVWSYQSP